LVGWPTALGSHVREVSSGTEYSAFLAMQRVLCFPDLGSFAAERR